ncbi:MAG: hypothetical protein JKY08_07620 [Flavobacteriaceae bacterium]|nr:hypothetical protein [Flavobacteriaceae bacterium]
MNYFYKILLLIFISSIISCAPIKKIADNTSPKIFYPNIQDSARIQFLTHFSYATDIRKKQSSFSKSITGENQDFEIRKPYGVEYKNNKIYVNDIGIGGLVIIDLKNETFNSFVPRGNGSLQMPLNSFIDQEENVYIADIEKNIVKKYNKGGNYIASFGRAENKGPSDVTILNNKIWVCDSKGNKITVYEEGTNKFLYQFPKEDVRPGNEAWLYMATNIILNEKSIYVSDMGSGSIKEYSHEGDFIRSIGSFGKNLGQFVRPKGIAIDKEENLFVVDGSFSNVQLFNKEGQLLLYFGGATGDKGGMYLPTTISISYDTANFEQYVDPKYNLKYLIFVANQYGPYKINIYGRVELKTEN